MSFTDHDGNLYFFSDITHRSFRDTMPSLTVLAWIVADMLLLLPPSIVVAQMNTANINGTVTDPQGISVAGAVVIARNLGTQQSRRTLTDFSGEFLMVQLPAGPYTITVAAPGFEEAEQPKITLHAGDHVRQDFSLRLSEENEAITVEANAATMQVESAEVKDVIDNNQVVDLPLKGRQELELATLSPGVVNPPGGTRGDSLQQTGSLINVLGNRTGHNLFLVDGVSVTDEYFNNAALMPSPDSTSEFSLHLTDYNAEFGGKSGGIINVITRSGTNDFHGSAYEFLRNDIVDARNYFAPAGISTPYHDNQFGATSGGPIVKNSTFFFIAYDGDRLRNSLSQVFSVPTAAQRNGNLSGLTAVHDPLTKAAVPDNNLNGDPNYNPQNPSTKVALSLLNLLPLPNRPGNRNNLQSVGQQTVDTTQLDLRIDQNLSSRDLVSIRGLSYYADEHDPFGSSVLNEALLPGFGRILDTKTLNLSVGEIHSSSKTVNEFRLGALRVSGGQKDPNAGNPFANTHGLTGTTPTTADMGYPYMNLSGLFSTIGTAPGFNTRIDDDIETFDNVSLVHGRNDFNFGAYFFHLGFNPTFPNNARGTYTFSGSYTGNPFADFLFGYPSQGQVGIGEGAENASTNWAHFYFQDDLQLTPHLKLNFGIRYEYNSNLVAQPNQTSDIDLSSGAARFVIAGNPAALSGQTAMLAAFAASQSPRIPVTSNRAAGWDESLLHERPLRLSPRIGLAWQLPGIRGTVLRTGFGVFTNQAAYSVLQNLAENIPLFLNKTVNNAASTPIFTTADILSDSPNGAIGANGVNQDFRIEYNEVWNLTLQKSLSSTAVFTAQYVGSRTVHADSSTAVNLPIPGIGAVQSRRPFPNLNSFTTIRWDGWACFDALTLDVTERKSHGLTFDGSYTWSHSMDDASDAGATNAEFDLPQNIYLNNLVAEKASSSFDHRNRTVANVTYDLPFSSSAGSWAHAAAGGWRVSGILIAQSGAPFTVNLATSDDLANIGFVNGNNIERPNTSDDPNHGPKSAAEWFNTAAFSLPAPLTFGNTPRNSILGPGFVNFDASLQKQWSMRDRVNFQFRIEAFNVLNHANFNLPGRIFGAANFGVITSAVDPRELQFALKISY